MQFISIILNQIFVLRQIYLKNWEFDREIHVLFIDLKKNDELVTLFLKTEYSGNDKEQKITVGWACLA